MHRSRLDVLPLPSRPHPGIASGLCRHCSLEFESLWHILTLCEAKPRIVRERHDTVLWRVVRLILFSLRLSREEEDRVESLIPKNQIVLNVKDGVKLYVNSHIPYLTDDKRPDIFYEDSIRKVAYIVDIRIVAEQYEHSLEAVRKDKIEKYSELAGILKRMGYNVFIDAFLMGAFGSFDPKNLAFMNLLGIPPLHTEHCIRFLFSQVVKYGCDLYHSYLV